MIRKALTIFLVTLLLVSATCFLTPGSKASTNLITNGGFEDNLATSPDSGNWEGGTRVNSDFYTGSYSLYTIHGQLVRQRITSLPDGSYYFSMMYKPIVPATMGFGVIFYGNIAPSSPNVVLVRVYADSVTEDYGTTGATVTIMSGGWRNLAFNTSLSRVGYPNFVDWHIKFPDTGSMDGFIDDVWLSTSGAISFYSEVSLVAPANGTSQSTLNANFTYTPSMNNSIVNASLWLNSYNTWNRVANTTTVTNGTLNNFTYALPYQGVYLWNIEVWDSSNYFFAPSNYSLTVQSGTTNHGDWYDSCEDTSVWTTYGSCTPMTKTVDYSDYMEGLGSTNMSWPNTPSAYGYALTRSGFNVTPPHVFGFYVKFGTWSSSTLDPNFIDIITMKGAWGTDFGGYTGFYVQANRTHFYLQWKWWTATAYDSATYERNATHWYWIEVSLPTNKRAEIFLDGAVAINSTIVAYSCDQVTSFTVKFYYGAPPSGSMKFDFMRIADAEEYPVFIINTIDVVSNPELNAFFSMATNASSLASETLCVNSFVDESDPGLMLGHVGSSPWLDTQDDNTSYLQCNVVTACYDQYFTFNHTTLTTISNAILHVRLACFPISLVVGVLVQVYIWNGSEYLAIEGFQRYGDWLTMNSSTLFSKGFDTPAKLNQMRLKVWMNLNQQVPGMTYFGRCTAIWVDVYGYGVPEGSAIHQTPYSFNPVSATYVFEALNTTTYDIFGNEYSFTGFNYITGSYAGSTLILTSLSGITSITLEYSMAPPPSVFLVPYMFLFWIIGLCCMFVSPIYAIDKVKKREYLTGFVGGVVFGAIGFGLFIGGLWGIMV